MKNKREKKIQFETTEGILDAVKLCFKELDLPIIEQGAGKEASYVRSRLDLCDFSARVDVEIENGNKTRLLNFRMTSSWEGNGENEFHAQRVINYMNRYLMTIAHFAMDQDNTDIQLLASVSLHGDRVKGKDVMEPMMDLMIGGVAGFILLRHMLLSDPDMEMYEFVKEFTKSMKC
jgi:hypothetical protein